MKNSIFIYLSISAAIATLATASNTLVFSQNSVPLKTSNDKQENAVTSLQKHIRELSEKVAFQQAVVDRLGKANDGTPEMAAKINYALLILESDYSKLLSAAARAPVKVDHQLQMEIQRKHDAITAFEQRNLNVQKSIDQVAGQLATIEYVSTPTDRELVKMNTLRDQLQTRIERRESIKQMLSQYKTDIHSSVEERKQVVLVTEWINGMAARGMDRCDALADAVEMESLDVKRRDLKKDRDTLRATLSLVEKLDKGKTPPQFPSNIQRDFENQDVGPSVEKSILDNDPANSSELISAELEKARLRLKAARNNTSTINSLKK